MNAKKKRFADGDWWVARPIIDGSKLYLKARAKDELEQQYFAVKLRQQRTRIGLSVDRGPITFDALADLYLAQYQHSASGKKTVSLRLARPRESFGSIRVKDLTPDGIGAWNARLPVGATFRGHVLKAMRRVLAYGVTCGYLEQNPAALVVAPKPDAPDIRPFESWEEVELVASKLGRLSPLVPFVCATGLRPQEWQALDWRYIDIPGRQLRVSRTVRSGSIVQGAKTTGSLRTVRLMQRALDALNELPRPLTGGLVFTGEQGGMIDLHNFARRRWRTALSRAELDYRPPVQMRHSFASLALSDGVPLEWISAQMGHDDVSITAKRYGRYSQRGDERWMHHLDEQWKSATGHESDTEAAAE